MPCKRAFLLFVILIGLGCHRLAADEAKISGKHLLIKESATLFVQDPDGTNRRKVAENAGAAAFSPDANLVAYVADKAVHVFSLLDGQSVTVAHLTDGFVNTLAWSPDQKHLAYDLEVRMKSWDLFLASYPPGDGAVFISSVDGKDQFQISKNAPSMGAKFSPDSKEVMFVDFNASRLVIGDLATRKLTPIPGSSSERYAYVVCDWK